MKMKILREIKINNITNGLFIQFEQLKLKANTLAPSTLHFKIVNECFEFIFMYIACIL